MAKDNKQLGNLAGFSIKETQTHKSKLKQKINLHGIHGQG